MKKIEVNQNLIIVIKSLVLTIIAIVILELVLSLMRSLGLNILNDSLLGNVLLEATIFIAQLLIIRRYSKGAIFSSIRLSKDREIIKTVFIGVAIGLIGTLLIYSSIFVLKIAFYKGTSFNLVLALISYFIS